MLVTAVLLFLGLVLLYYGAEALIHGSVSLALRMGLPPLVIGLTIVGYGTGMPELVVSVDASINGYGEIAIGNIIGSNICNVGLILGLTALIKPLAVKSRLVRYDLPIMLVIAIGFYLFLYDGDLTRWKGAFFLASLCVYTYGIVKYSRAFEEDAELEKLAPSKSRFVDLVFIVSGLAALWLGARFFVASAVDIARFAGLSEAVIGLSLVAFGTSLPELATSIIAIVKNQRDIAIGNVIGSNIFNLLAIGGVAGLIHPFTITGVTAGDYWVMIAFSAALLPMMKSGFSLNRIEGGILFAAYIAYLYTLI